MQLLAPDKIEIKREMLSEYQLKIAYLYNIWIGDVKKLVPSLFWGRKVCTSIWRLATLLDTIIKTKKTSHIRIQSFTMVENIYWIKHTKKNRNRKNMAKIKSCGKY